MLSSLLFFFCSADARGIFNNPSSPFSYNLACLVGYIAGIAAVRQQEFNTRHPSSDRDITQTTPLPFVQQLYANITANS
jgi:hypothetical protein